MDDSYFCRIFHAHICFIFFYFLFIIPLFIFFIEIDASFDIAWSTRRCPSFDIHIVVIKNHSTRDATTPPTRRCFVKRCITIIIIVVVVVISSIGISGSVLTLKRFRIGKGNSSQTWSIAAGSRSTLAFRHRLLSFLFGSHNGRCRCGRCNIFRARPGRRCCRRAFLLARCCRQRGRRVLFWLNGRRARDREAPINIIMCRKMRRRRQRRQRRGIGQRGGSNDGTRLLPPRRHRFAPSHLLLFGSLFLLFFAAG